MEAIATVPKDSVKALKEWVEANYDSTTWLFLSMDLLDEFLKAGIRPSQLDNPTPLSDELVEEVRKYLDKL
jgi:hypothetical protein